MFLFILSDNSAYLFSETSYLYNKGHRDVRGKYI